eukprot:7388471-Karenia_brevis.AAC.1
MAADATFRELCRCLIEEIWADNDRHLRVTTLLQTTAVASGLEVFNTLPLDPHGTLAGTSVAQVHQDWAKQENARASTCTHSVTARDFRHAIQQMKEELPS